jgi:peroxiredoxin
MNAWADQQKLRKVKVLPDGNGDFTRSMGMLVEKTCWFWSKKLEILCNY